MPLNLSQKKDLVKEMSTVLSDAEVVLTADYSGLTSNELNQLRKTTREAGVFIKLVKNNMLKMALKDSQFASMAENVSGENPCKGFLRIALVHKEDLVVEAFKIPLGERGASVRYILNSLHNRSFMSLNKSFSEENAKKWSITGLKLVGLAIFLASSMKL